MTDGYETYDVDDNDLKRAVRNIIIDLGDRKLQEATYTITVNDVDGRPLAGDLHVSFKAWAPNGEEEEE